MGAEKAVVNTAGSGQAFWMLGGLYEVLLSSDETNGEMTVMQMTMAAGMDRPRTTIRGRRPSTGSRAR